MIKFRDDIKVELIQHMGSDDMIARAARVSTGKDQVDNLKNEGLIKYLAEHRHTSPFEHTAATFRIEAPIFVAREAFRHRVFSFNEISGRYASLPQEFYLPNKERPIVNKGSGARPDLQHDDSVDYQWSVDLPHRAIYIEASAMYEKMLGEGVANEVARNVLPVGTYTAWYQTGNLHAWLHFLGLRDAPNAQYEIQDMARQVKDQLRPIFPVAMNAWDAVHSKD